MEKCAQPPSALHNITQFNRSILREKILPTPGPRNFFPRRKPFKKRENVGTIEKITNKKHIKIRS